MSSEAFCGFIDSSSENGFISTFYNRWTWYVNEGAFITPSYPPTNFGLLLPVMVVSSLIFHYLMYTYGSDWFSKKYSTTFKKKIINEEKERREWNSRIVSNIHAIGNSLISLYCIVFVYLPSPNAGILGLSDDSCIVLVGYGVGYFLYDLYIVIKSYPHLGGMETILHHTVSISALLGSAIWEKCVVLIVIMMFTEVSTPFVNQRYFFSKCNMKDSKLYTYNGIVMWLSFGIVRISFCFYIPYLIWEDSLTWCSFPIGWIIVVYLMFLVMSFLNIFWFYKITTGLLQVVFAKKPSNSAPSTSSTPDNKDKDEKKNDEKEKDTKVATKTPLTRR